MKHYSVLVSAHKFLECLFHFSGQVTIFTLITWTYMVVVSPYVVFLTNRKTGNAKDRILVEGMSALHYRNLTRATNNESAGIQGELIAAWVRVGRRTQVVGKETER